MTIAFALLLDMTLKATLLCLAGFAAARIARRRSAALRHDLWMAAIACCAMLPFVSGGLRMFDPALPIVPVHDAVMAVTASLPAGAPAGAMEAVDRIWSGDGGPPDSGWTSLLLIALWLAGFLVAALRGLAGYWAAAAIVRRARPFVLASPPRRARLLITSEVATPAVFGLFSPVVLLPAGAAEWSDERLRAVLAHENAHIDRRDCAIELLVQIACAFHWFNPLVRAAARSLRADREFACDERVLVAGFDPRLYADALVQVARHAFAAPRRAMLAMARAPELERRVLMLLGPARMTAGRAGLRAVLLWPAAILFMLFAAVTTPASGLLASGSVQPLRPVSGLDDPLSERLPFPYERFAATLAGLPAVGPDAAAIAGLKPHLAHQPRGYGDLIRERTIWTLAQARDGRLFEPLAGQVSAADWRVRAYAAWGLAMTGDRRATPLLSAMLDDPVWRVRAMAAGGIAGLGDPAAAEAVGAILDDPAWQVRMAAIDYVERVGDPVLIRRLRPLLGDPHPGTRLRARDLFDRI